MLVSSAKIKVSVNLDAFMYKIKNRGPKIDPRGTPHYCLLRRARLIKLAFLTPCDQAFNPPFLGGKIIELAKFCFQNKRFEPSLSFFSKQVIVSHCV